MEIDRNRFQRKASLSRGTSVYVSSSSGGIQAIPSVHVQQQSPPETEVAEHMLPLGAPARQHELAYIADHVDELSRVATTGTADRSKQTTILQDDDGEVFDQWIRSAGFEDNAQDQYMGEGIATEEPRIDVSQQKRRLRSVRLPAFLKPVLYVLGVLVLFGLSVGAGYLSRPSAESSQGNSEQANASQQPSSGQGASTQQSQQLSVSQASSALGPNQGIIAQTQGTNTGVDVRQRTDTYLGGKINITVQPLPDNYRADPAKALKDFATNLKATGTVQSSRYGTVYVLTADGVQVLAFITNTKLVVLQSFAVHTNSEWKTYVDAMNP